VKIAITLCVCVSLCLFVCVCLFICLSVYLSVCLSVCLSVHKITHECIEIYWPNLIGTGKVDPLEVIQFWCWSNCGCSSVITFALSLSLQDIAFYDICLFARWHHHASPRYWVHLQLELGGSCPYSQIVKLTAFVVKLSSYKKIMLILCKVILDLLLWQGWWRYVIVRSIILSVSRIAGDRNNGRQPNIVGISREWLISGVDPERMWICDHFPTSINIMQILLYTMYFDSTGGATMLVCKICSCGL